MLVFKAVEKLNQLGRFSRMWMWDCGVSCQTFLKQLKLVQLLVTLHPAEIILLAGLKYRPHNAKLRYIFPCQGLF